MFGKETVQMRNLTKLVFMAFVFGFIGFAVSDTAMAQNWRKERREARREYRREVREARREYREDRREWRQDRRRNDRLNRYYRVGPRGRAYGYYNRRPYVGNRRYSYPQRRVYRRW